MENKLIASLDIQSLYTNVPFKNVSANWKTTYKKPLSHYPKGHNIPQIVQKLNQVELNINFTYELSLS